jgi:hypothetical protein
VGGGIRSGRLSLHYQRLRPRPLICALVIRARKCIHSTYEGRTTVLVLYCMYWPIALLHDCAPYCTAPLHHSCTAPLTLLPDRSVQEAGGVVTVGTRTSAQAQRSCETLSTWELGSFFTLPLSPVPDRCVLLSQLTPNPPSHLQSHIGCGPVTTELGFLFLSVWRYSSFFTGHRPEKPLAHPC